MSNIYSDEMSEKERADRLEAMVDRMAETIVNLRGELFAANELLRSTNNIVTRQGWEAFGARVEIALQRQHRLIYKQGSE